MRIKFVHQGPRLVGAHHYFSGDKVDFHENLARRLIRGGVAEPDNSPLEETAVVSEKLEVPEKKKK